MIVGQFLRWWFTELGRLMPSPLRGAAHGGAKVLHLRVDDEQIQFFDRANKQRLLGSCQRGEELSAGASVIEGLGRFNASSTLCEVCLPAHMVLAKDLQLPLATQENLDEVLAFEMERHTPFQVRDVYFSYRVTGRDVDARQLKLRLNVVPRKLVTPILALFPGWELEQAAGAMALEDDSADASFWFRARQFQHRSAIPTNLALVAVVCVLLVVVVAVPLVFQRQQLMALEQRSATVREAAMLAVAVGDELTAEQERSLAVFQAKLARQPMVELVDEVSTRLPDDTALFRLEVRQGMLHLQGTSSRPTALISVLEDSANLQGVRFQSPLTQEGSTGKDRFHISAQLVLRPSTNSNAAAPVN